MDIMIQLLILLAATIAVGFVAIDFVAAFAIGHGWKDSVIVSGVARMSTGALSFVEKYFFELFAITCALTLVGFFGIMAIIEIANR